MADSVLSSREYEFNHPAIEPLDVFEDPTGTLRGGVGSTIWDAAIVLSKYFEKSNLYVPPRTPGAPKPIRVLELGSGTGIVGLAVARLISSKGLQGRVVLTDKENVVPLLQKNTERNPSKGVQIEAQVLDWEVISGIPATVVLSSATSEGDANDADSGSKEDDTSVAATSTKVIPEADQSSTTVATTTPSATLPSGEDLSAVEWDLVIVSDCIWVAGLYESLVGTLDKLITSRRTQLVISFEKRNFSEEMEFFAKLGKIFRFRDVKPEEQDSNWQSEDIYLFLCERRA